MTPWHGPRMIDVISACMHPDGTPHLVLNHAEVTREEAENGIHFYLVEADLLQAGYEEPFVHFEEDETLAFLHAAVRAYRGVRPPQSKLVSTPVSEAH